MTVIKWPIDLPSQFAFYPFKALYVMPFKGDAHDLQRGVGLHNFKDAGLQFICGTCGKARASKEHLKESKDG